jgi:hypothetical protein
VAQGLRPLKNSELAGFIFASCPAVVDNGEVRNPEMLIGKDNKTTQTKTQQTKEPTNQATNQPNRKTPRETCSL